MEYSQEIQSKFFNITAELFEEKIWSHSNVDKTLQKLIDTIEMDSIALYIQLEDTPQLRLLAAVSKANLQFKIKIPIETIETQDFFIGESSGYEIHVFPIQVNDSEKLRLVLINNDEFSQDELCVLEKEIQKLFRVIERTLKNALQDQWKEFLLDTSAKLIKAQNKGDVVQVIFDALNVLYSDYRYHLVVTQEFEEAAYYPIKVMEYSDERPFPMRTQVFMTGELQLEELPERSEKVVYAPLIGNQSVYGVLEIVVPINHYFFDYELDFIAEFAILSGKALEKMMLYDHSLTRVSDLTLLNGIVHELNASLGLSELTALIKMKILNLTKASEVGFIYFDEQSESEFEILPESTSFFMGEKGREVIRVYKDEIMKTCDAIFSGNAVDFHSYGFQSAMVIPMVYSGLSIGYTMILHEDKYRFTFEQFRLIKKLVQHSALAISNTILRERLQMTVIMDFLTQLYTRKYLEEKMEEHRQSGKKAALLLFDIDDFKRVNDRFGHHVGDNVLKQVAQIIDGTVGENGIAARWGGEELAVYLPEVTVQEALDYANRIRKKISFWTEPAITVSCGISYWENGFDEAQQKLFLRADHALYEAKAAGKNQVIYERSQ